MSFMSFASEMLGNLFKPPATSQYPFKPRKVYEADRGKVINNIDNCIFCGMCMRNCPSDAITVDRNARTWKINRFACVLYLLRHVHAELSVRRHYGGPECPHLEDQPLCLRPMQRVRDQLPEEVPVHGHGIYGACHRENGRSAAGTAASAQTPVGPDGSTESGYCRSPGEKSGGAEGGCRSGAGQSLIMEAKRAGCSR